MTPSKPTPSVPTLPTAQDSAPDERYPVHPKDDEALRTAARALIHAGVIPVRDPERTWGGRGSGVHCPVCTRVISRHELEMELEFQGSRGLDMAFFHMHIPCYAAWDAARRQSTTGVLPAKTDLGIIGAREAQVRIGSK